MLVRRHAAEDEALRERVAARNGLEQYCYSLRNSVSGNDGQVGEVEQPVVPS